jgi:protein ImuB
VEPGSERRALAAAALADLSLDEDLVATLARWGVVTLGDLAALPRAGVAARLGAAGAAAHDLACGHDRQPFRPWTPPPFWEEAQGLDWEIDSFDALRTVLAGVLDRLCARLAAAQLLVDALDVRLALASGARHARAVALAAPTGEPAPILAVLVLDLAAHPPAASVVGVAVSARVVPRRAVGRGLWEPPVPATRDLAAALARLATLVGPENIGAPVLLDSHHPDAVALAPFVPDAGRGAAVTPSPPIPEEEGSRLALRRLRPPRGLEVTTDAGGRPALVRGALGPEAGVIACAGPWRISGEWWDTRAWSRDEWDVALADGTLCRLARDHHTHTWHLDGVYD